MNNIQIFESNEFGKVRTVAINGTPYFVANDVANVLGYVKPRNAIVAHCKGALKQGILTNGGTQEMVIIPESDVYRLVFRSKLPTAERFEDWVTTEVLPTVRKTGEYSITQSQLSKEELIIRKQESEARLLEAKTRQGELWLKLGTLTAIPEYKQIAQSYAANTLAGKEVFSLPEVNKKTYSATEIGNMLGISANKVGRIAKQYGLKTKEYGKLFYDKARHSNKEVETFRYYEMAVTAIGEIITKEEIA